MLQLYVVVDVRRLIQVVRGVLVAAQIAGVAIVFGFRGQNQIRQRST